MSSTDRIKNGCYTEADVQAIFMKHRENRIGPFTREVGDFIAHPSRDRGVTLEGVIYLYSQLAVFQTYQGTNKQNLEPMGPCGWWLRPYLLSKIRESWDQNLVNLSGLTKKEAKNHVKSWFERENRYPTEIKCRQPNILIPMMKHFAKVIESKPVFDYLDVTTETLKLFELENIEKSELQRFIVGAATLLNGKTVEIVPGLTIQTTLNINPKGRLTILAFTFNKTGDGVMDLAMDFFSTEIEAQPYLSDALYKSISVGQPLLKVQKPLSFDTNKPQPVYTSII